MKPLFLKDMAFHKARVILTTVAIMALAMLVLLLGGIMNGLRWQARRYPEFTGADIWISSERSGGVFVGFSILNPEYVKPFLQNEEGLDPDSLSELIFAQVQPVIKGKERKAVVVGYHPGRMGGPKQKDLAVGRLFRPGPEEYAPEAQLPPAEVVVDETIGLEVGETIELWGKHFRVVGKIKNIFFVFDTPMIFMDLSNAQDGILQRAIYVNCFIGKVRPGYDPETVAARVDELSTVEARTTAHTIKTILRNYVDEPMKGVEFLRFMLWLSSGLIVLMITYVTTLEKTQEIGILKAIGASNRFIISMTMKQVLLISSIGLVAGIILARLSVYAFPIFVLISWRETMLVAIVTLFFCSVGGYWAARRVMYVDPMIAFRGELEM